LDSGFVTTEDRVAKPVIEKKDGSQPLWVGLLGRTEFMACPDCAKKNPVNADKPKRAYTKKSPRWSM